MQAEQVSIFGLYNMLFSRVPKRGAEVDEVGRISDRR
jgi:hypothetical protein